MSTWGDATTAGNYTLVFSGSSLGDFVEDFKTTVRRNKGVQRRQNFWSTNVILDGKYPGVVWEHQIKIYVEKSSREAFFNEFTSLSSLILGDRQDLRINDVDSGTAQYDFGKCYMKNFKLDTPDAFIKHPAGFFVLNFVGNEAPS